MSDIGLDRYRFNSNRPHLARHLVGGRLIRCVGKNQRMGCIGAAVVAFSEVLGQPKRGSRPNTSTGSRYYRDPRCLTWSATRRVIQRFLDSLGLS